MIYTLEQLKRRILPLTRKYGISDVYVYGSYAHGQANSSSNINLLIKRKDTGIKTLFDLGALHEELSRVLKKKIDLVTEESLKDPLEIEKSRYFIQKLEKEKVALS